MTTTRPSISTAIILAVLALALVQCLRWQITSGADAPYVVYRLDRLTGEVEISMAGQPWQRIEAP